MDEAMKIVEAVLFSTDRPMRVGEIAKIGGLRSEEVSKAMRKLREEYEQRDGAIEIVRIGNKYVMQLRDEYVNYGYSVGKKEMNDDVLKTLAIIAYYQPITQRKLREMLGTKVYQHVDELKKRGLIYGKKSGRTEILRTTKRFNEYFGIDASRPEEIKKFFENAGGEKND
uniref:Predicted transcriptional regulator containing the HTH domain n=1 Tax=uncultured euryarchaeote Alv-FOS4 TaxID=337893 RepID=Q3SA89_9EURY|nr:predicted transcriptional regulator containing the HTH domain [uncultured euryarchaeote Alv-FOS4]